MATAGALVPVGTLKLQKEDDRDPWYRGIVVSGDMLMVADVNAYTVRLYRCRDGKLLSTSDRLESDARGICLINDMEICMFLRYGTIQIMSVQCTGDTGAITRGRTLLVNNVFDECQAAVRFMDKDKVVVSGKKKDTICWCIVSLNDGHVDRIHQICEGIWSNLTTKNNMIYISCDTGPVSPGAGVYGYDIRKPKQQPLIYKHNELRWPTGITVDAKGFIFVCNMAPPCIYHLTDKCELVTKYSKGIPWRPYAIFWDQELLYVSCIRSNVITLYKRDGETSSFLSRLKQKLGLDRSHKKLASQHSQDRKVPEVPLSNETKQPVSEKTSTGIEQAAVGAGHSSAETEMQPSVQAHKDSEDDKQGPVIPMEILRMDDKSIQLYKEALQDGKEKVYNIRVMMVGHYGVGKTTLTKRLLGQQVDMYERKSTEGIDVYKHCCKISLKTGEWIVQPKDSDQMSRLHRLRKLLADRPESAEVGGVKEGHCEVIYTRETIHEENLFDPIYYGNSNGDDYNISSCSESDNLQEVDSTSTAREEMYERHVDIESSSVAIEENRHVTSDIEEMDPMMELLQLLGENADKLEKSIVDSAALGIWDFAGQCAFYTTHQTFLTYRAIYLLVTDLTQQVTDIVNDDKCNFECYFDSKEAGMCQVQDLVEVWLNSIHSCAPFLLAAGIPATSVSGTPVTSHARIPVTLPASSIPVASLAAGIPGTSPVAGMLLTFTPVTTPAASTSVTFPAADIPVNSPVASIQLTSSAFGTLVTSPAADIPVTFPAASTHLISSSFGTLVTSPTADFPLTLAAGNAVTIPEVSITVTSPVASTPLTSAKASTPVTHLAAGTSVASHAAGITVTFPDVDIQATPPVILVGTHVDKIQEEKRQEVINKYVLKICSILNDKPASQHLVGVFSIDNTQIDPELETLKKKIFEVASKQPYWGEEVPANWLLLEEVLMKLKASGIKVIPFHLVEKLNKKGSIPIKTTEQLDLFLRFQHDIGNIIYFSEEGLRENIVLDPQWLIDAQKSLITAEMFILQNKPYVMGKLFEFKNKGILTHELIDAIWTKDNNPDLHDNKKYILHLLEKLNIISKPRSYSEDGSEIKVEDYFLAPCMLSETTPREVIFLGSHPEMESSSVLCYVFVEKFLPPPIFHRLLAACVAHWPIAKKKSEHLIFCGCCVFQLDLHHKLTVCFRNYVIFARVMRMGTSEKTPSSKLCIEVQKFITTTLSYVIGYLGQSLRFEYFIQCPKADGCNVDCLIPVANLQGNIDVPCHSHDNSHMIISHDVLKFWFQEEEHSDDAWKNKNLGVQEEIRVSPKDQAGNMRTVIDRTEEVYVLDQLVQRAKSVGIIKSPVACGTGFRVGPDYIMTAKHVVDSIMMGAPVPLQQQMQLNPHQQTNTSVFIDFSYERNGLESDENQRFYFEPEIVYANDYLDTVILKLRPDPREFPPPLTKFSDITQLSQCRTHGYFIGHSRADIKKKDNYYFVKMTREDITAAREWSMQLVNMDGFVDIDNPHRVLFHCSFERGASGAPGFWICPSDGQAYVELMLLRGYPTWYYDEKYKEKTTGIPNSRLYEQGVSMKSIYDDMLKTDESLFKAIFEMRT